MVNETISLHCIYAHLHFIPEPCSLRIFADPAPVDSCSIDAGAGFILRPVALPLDQIKAKPFHHAEIVSLSSLHGHHPPIPWTNQVIANSQPNEMK